MKLFPETKLTLDAKKSRWRHVWIIDILIALLLMIISTSIQSIILTPALMVWLFTGTDLGTAIANGDPSSAMEQVMTILNAQPAWLSVLSLFLTVVVIVVCIIYCTKLEKRPLSGLGFAGPNPFGEYAVGYLVGVGIFALAWALCLITGTAKLRGLSPTFSWTIVFFFLGFLVQGMSEEVLCRGFLMHSVANRYAPIVAIVLNSLFFAALHLLNSGIAPLAFVNLFLFGAFASVYTWRRGNLWGIAALHSAWNFTQGNLLGILVSGQDFGPSVLSTELTEQGAWMNGGTFGLEGGLAVTVVLVLGTVVLLLLPTRKSARVEA